MAYGFGLGILLVLVQAEHVCCSWAAKAWSSQNGNYAGFSQQDGRLRVAGSLPQNRVRQVFVSPRSGHRSSPNPETGVQSGSGQGLPISNSYTPAWSSAKLQSSLPKPSWQSTSPSRVSSPAVPRQSFGLSTAIASGVSVGKSQRAGVDQSLSTQRAMQRSSKRPSSTGKPGSTLFSPVGSAPHGSPARMQTYARAPARRVFSNRGSKPSTPVKPPMTQMYPGTGARSQGSYKPSSTVGASAPGFAPVSVYEIPQRFGGSPIRRLRDPAQQDEVRVQKPQQTPPPLQKTVYKPQLPSVHPGSKWSRVSLRSRPQQARI